jgi:hypothetical protein
MSHDLASVSAKAHWAGLFVGLSGRTLSIAAGKLSGSYGGEISVELTSIKSVSVSQSFFGKLLGFGTVLIATPSGTKSLGFVANPEAFASELEDAAAAAKKASKPSIKAAPAPVAAPVAAPAPIAAPIAAPAPEVLHVERTVAPAAPAQAAEAAKQSTTSDEDSYKGKTVAMSMEDFEALLKAQTEKP